MIGMILTVTLRAEWSDSLKDRRAVIRSLVSKLKSTFNVSVAESGDRDSHRTIVLTIAALTDGRSSGALEEKILRFIERTADAELVGFERVDF